ncbi:MAG: DUF4931 domain-containing protein, partial [Pseudanabaenaceae cyanobacterium]
MSELRQNVLTGDWVVFAKGRARRPHELVQPLRYLDPIPPYHATCPFCPGQEGDNADEVLRLFLPGQGDRWQVRVVRNKFPAFTTEGERIRQTVGLYRRLTGVGHHEVIIEHPCHNQVPARMSVPEIALILEAYYQRYVLLRRDPRVEAIILFKNHGEAAGSSLIHPHSQLTAVPIVPYQFRVHIEEAIRYLDSTGECIFCRMLQEELAAGDRLVCETTHFVAFCPYAALVPFQILILPRRHASAFDDITTAELWDLAKMLKQVLWALYQGLNNPDYNYTVRSVPTDDAATDYFHWHLSVMPRASKIAGFELGSGMFINTVMPEESAAFLREQLAR